MTRPEIGARLDHLLVASPEPGRGAASVAQLLNVGVEPCGDMLACGGPRAAVLFHEGSKNTLSVIAFSFETVAELERFRARLLREGAAIRPNCSPVFADDAFCVADPGGVLVAFGHRDRRADSAGDGPTARLQHVGVRTLDIEPMRDFYEKVLHFVISDKVEDDDGVQRAAFLRTDAEHHTLALFLAPEARLDHLSFDTPDRRAICDWADRVTARRIPLFWGLGRHGPGNDLFFMVKDADENLVEFSTELEICEPDRPVGNWAYTNWTMNLWGQAFMRS